MSKKLQLEIADPCHENWDKMTKAEQGRFCGACQKTVIDFTTKTDREIVQFFKKPSTGSVCGRFMNDQLDRELEIPNKRIPWLKYFFQLAIPAFLMSMKATAQGKVRLKGKVATVLTETPVSKPVCTTEAPVEKMKPHLLGDTTLANRRVPEVWENPTENFGTLVAGGISAKIVDDASFEITVSDENDNPVPYASVIIAGTTKGWQTDEYGDLALQPGKKWKKLELIISSAGFEEKKITVNKKDLVGSGLAIILKAKTDLPEVVVTAFGNVRKGYITMGYTTTKGIKVTKDESETLTPTATNKLDVYPNPVMSGTTINIAGKDLQEGYYSFSMLNMSGQVIHQREVWVDNKATVLNFDLPSAPAGNYVLRLINKQTGTSFSEKIVVR